MNKKTTSPKITYLDLCCFLSFFFLNSFLFCFLSFHFFLLPSFFFFFLFPFAFLFQFLQPFPLFLFPENKVTKLVKNNILSLKHQELHSNKPLGKTRQNYVFMIRSNVSFRYFKLTTYLSLCFRASASVLFLSSSKRFCFSASIWGKNCSFFKQCEKKRQ